MIYITHSKHLREFWMGIFNGGLTYFIVADDMVVSVSYKEVSA